jgi:hypothetical protein
MSSKTVDLEVGSMSKVYNVNVDPLPPESKDVTNQLKQSDEDIQNGMVRNGRELLKSL